MMKHILIAAALALIPPGVSAQQQQQLPPMLMINNNSPAQGGAGILKVFAVPSFSGGGWGIDRLGGVAIGSASVFSILLGGTACTYDVRIEYSNNQSSEFRNVYVCGNNWLTVSGGYHDQGGQRFGGR